MRNPKISNLGQAVRHATLIRLLEGWAIMIHHNTEVRAINNSKNKEDLV